MDIKSIAKRTVSGVVYIALIVGAIIGGTDWIGLLALLFGTLAVTEFTKISLSKSSPRIVETVMDILLVWAIIGVAYCSAMQVGGKTDYNILLISDVLFIPLIFFARCIVELYSVEGSPLKSVAYSALKYCYIGIPLGCMVLLSTFSPIYLLVIFILIWVNDTFAFLFGCTFGKHKMFQRISPKKTWEGYFGGLFSTVVASILISMFWKDAVPVEGMVFALLLGIVVTAFATWGDLFESMIKRTLLIKDSGNIIPGHGGILDRIDSLLFVMPASLILTLFYILADISFILF